VVDLRRCARGRGVLASVDLLPDVTETVYLHAVRQDAGPL
jgi:hypothetical protein